MSTSREEVSLTPPNAIVSDGAKMTGTGKCLSRSPAGNLPKDEVQDLIARLEASPRTSPVRAQQLDSCIAALQRLSSLHPGARIEGEHYTLKQIAILWANTELDRPATWDPERQRPMPAFTKTERRWLGLDKEDCKWRLIVTSFTDFLPCALTEYCNYLIPESTANWHLVKDPEDPDSEFPWIQQLRQYFRDYNRVIYISTTLSDVARAIICEYLWVLGEDQARTIEDSWDIAFKAPDPKVYLKSKAGTGECLSQPSDDKDYEGKREKDDKFPDCTLSRETMQVDNVLIQCFYPGRIIRVQKYQLDILSQIPKNAYYYTRDLEREGVDRDGMDKFLADKYHAAYQRVGGSKRYISFRDKVNQLMAKKEDPHMPLLHVRPVTAACARIWDHAYNRCLDYDRVPYWLVCFYKPDGTPMWHTDLERSLTSVWENCTRKGGYKAHRR